MFTLSGVGSYNCEGNEIGDVPQAFESIEWRPIHEVFKGWQNPDWPGTTCRGLVYDKSSLQAFKRTVQDQASAQCEHVKELHKKWSLV